MLPAVLGNIVLLAGTAIGKQRAARRISGWLVGFLAPPLAGFSIAINGDLPALALRPSVIVFNHQSGVDPVVMARLASRDSTGLAKGALRRHWLLGPMLRMQGAIFVNADAADTHPLTQAAARMRRERLAVLVAPEGRRGLELGRFRSGASRLAQEAAAPIVAVVIHDSGAILPPGALVMRPGRIHVTVLGPLEPHVHDPQSLQALFQDALAVGF